MMTLIRPARSGELERRILAFSPSSLPPLLSLRTYRPHTHPPNLPPSQPPSNPRTHPRRLDLIADDGSMLLQAKVEVTDVQLLRRMHAANRLREADERISAQEKSAHASATSANATAPLRMSKAEIRSLGDTTNGAASAPAGAPSAAAAAPPRFGSGGRSRMPRSMMDLNSLKGNAMPAAQPDDLSLGALLGEEADAEAVSPVAAAGLDMVDALRSHVADECVLLASHLKVLNVSKFISNPDVAELSALLPRLEEVSTLSSPTVSSTLLSPPSLVSLLSFRLPYLIISLTTCLSHLYYHPLSSHTA